MDNIKDNKERQEKQDSQIRAVHFKMYEDCNCIICNPKSNG